jgi:multidrug efflux pump subunit AcrB
VPPGTARIGTFEYTVHLNNSPSAIDDLNKLPIRTVGGTTITIGDVAHVHDGSPPQQNIVRVNGTRAVLMTILKAGSASTVAIVDGVKKIVPQLQLTLPSDLHISFLSDQSVFVKGAVSGVIREGVIAAVLTSLMILLFLGSWRSTVIIATSIPLAVLAAVMGLAMTGETLNIMTLGGLSLAVGILVDDATVTIENINWHLEQGKGVQEAILDGAQQIVQPALVSLLCICIAFVPMFFLPGVAGFLFAPMAKSVVFAMIASFILSRTLVPTMGNYLLRAHAPEHIGEQMREHDAAVGHPGTHNPLRRFQHGFEVRFEKIRSWYVGALSLALNRRKQVIVGFAVIVALSLVLVPFLAATSSGGGYGPDRHSRPRAGWHAYRRNRRHVRPIEDRVRSQLPKGEIASMTDNIGPPVSGINRAYSNTGGIGPQDGDILISLKEDHGATDDYVRQLRADLPKAFPGTVFSFLPVDIVSQILNFGAPAPIDVMVTGPDATANEAYAHMVAAKWRALAAWWTFACNRRPTIPRSASTSTAHRRTVWALPKMT